LRIRVTATDAENMPHLTTSTLPLGAVFVDSLNGRGGFVWTPSFVQSGIYVVSFIATDDSTASDTDIVIITINGAPNQLPTLATIGAKTVTEGFLLSFAASATDPEGFPPVLTTSVLPAGATFVDSANGRGGFVWTPGFTQSGVYTVTFRATDDSLTVDSEIVTITVNNSGNNTPILAPIPDTSVTETFNLRFNISATDADGTTPVLATSLLPAGATFVDSTNGRGTFNWTPTYSQNGVYLITFFASDGIGLDSQVVIITVFDVGNQSPVLDSIRNRAGTEGVLLQFVITSSDAESNPILTSTALPAGATFVDSGNGHALFSWTPTFTQSGVYAVTFFATDDSSAVD
ncbi:MAG: putative Ig domain-containing protein, partial [Candidatus Zixiibacteriota bacterium]